MPAYPLNHNVETIAAELGMNLVRPGPRDLFLDIDNNSVFLVDYSFNTILNILKNHDFPLELVARTVSRSGNAHYYLKTPRDITPLERIALQAILGSDRKREALGFLNIENKLPDSSVFFEVPHGRKILLTTEKKEN